MQLLERTTLLYPSTSTRVPITAVRSEYGGTGIPVAQKAKKWTHDPGTRVL